MVSIKIKKFIESGINLARDSYRTSCDRIKVKPREIERERREVS